MDDEDDVATDTVENEDGIGFEDEEESDDEYGDEYGDDVNLNNMKLGEDERKRKLEHSELEKRKKYLEEDYIFGDYLCNIIKTEENHHHHHHHHETKLAVLKENGKYVFYKEKIIIERVLVAENDIQAKEAFENEFKAIMNKDWKHVSEEQNVGDSVLLAPIKRNNHLFDILPRRFPCLFLQVFDAYLLEVLFSFLDASSMVKLMMVNRELLAQMSVIVWRLPSHQELNSASGDYATGDTPVVLCEVRHDALWQSPQRLVGLQISVDRFQDQGWGNIKGYISLEIKNKENSSVFWEAPFGNAPHHQTDFPMTRMYNSQSPLIQHINELKRQDNNNKLLIIYGIGGGGGHTLTIQGLQLRFFYCN